MKVILNYQQAGLATANTNILELTTNANTANTNISDLTIENSEQAQKIEILESTNKSLKSTINSLKELTNALINQTSNGSIVVGNTVTLGSNSLSGTYTATEETPNINIIGSVVNNQIILSNAENVNIDSLELNLTEAINGVTIKAEDTINVNSLELNGTLSGSANQIDITSAKDIQINNSVITANGYNGLMIAQYEETNIPSSIIIENMKFDGEISNNTLTFGSLTENAKVIIKDCYFGKSYNPLRFRNQLNATGIQVLIENCHFEDWTKDTNSGRCGLILFEDAITWENKFKTNYTDYPLLQDETAAQRVTRLYPELIRTEYENNRFGSDKFTITFKNCTYGADYKKLIYSSDEYASLFGTGTENQLIGIVLHSNRRTFLLYAPVPDTSGNTYFCKPFPYTETPYIAEYLGNSMDPIPTGGAQYYPTIIFE